MGLSLILETGIYSIPIIIGGIFFEKSPIFMGGLILFGCILVSVSLWSEVKTAEARRRFVGYGDLK